MFKQVQIPFLYAFYLFFIFDFLRFFCNIFIGLIDRYLKTPSRQNFLNSSYLMRQFCTILKWDAYRQCFPYPKSAVVLRLQEKIKRLHKSNFCVFFRIRCFREFVGILIGPLAGVFK